MDKFIDAYMKKFGVMPDVQAAGYYDAMKMMLSESRLERGQEKRCATIWRVLLMKE